MSAAPASGTRVALVTGAAGGIGSAICRRLVADGVGQIVLGHRSTSPDDLAAELAAAGVQVRSVRLDLAESRSVAEAVGAAVAAFGRLDLLVHAAGPHVPMVHLSKVEPGQFAEHLHAEAAGFFSLVHAALPALRSSRGCVVAVTTAATSRYPVRDGLSSGPKAAVESLVRAFAREEGRFGVRFNAVGPGMLTDGMASRLIGSGDLDERALSVARANIPLGVFGTAEDVAEAVAFLASPRAGFVTGQKLDVDGGYGV